MKASSSAERPKHTQITSEAQAAALWMFVQARAPRFSMESARDVVRRLAPQPGEDPKPLAKRLCVALQVYRVKLKHANALQAASLIAGFTSWHTNENDDTSRLKFSTYDESILHETHFRSWDDLAFELRAWAGRLLARGQLPLGVLTLSASDRGFNFTTPVPAEKDDVLQQNQAWPLGTITPAVADPKWLDGAHGALSKLRRHLEEDGHAVLDGYAVLRLCANSGTRPIGMPEVNVADVGNSELVLMREDNEDDPNSAYEIARGDELTCWYQLELSQRNDSTNEMPPVQVTIPTEGVGAWLVNGKRYVWSVETLKPKEYVPGRVNHQIGIADCEHLLRRYNLAKRIQGKSFKHHEQSKRVDYLAGPPETYRVDLHFLLHELNKTGRTWEFYIKEFGADPLEMQADLPVGFVFSMLENLQIEKPNQVFARPNISEMARVTDDALLRALRPRVDHVRYVPPNDLDGARATALKEAVEEFFHGLRTHQMFKSGGLQTENELPHLVWATEPEELRLTADALGLVMYAATIPHLHSTKGILPEVPGIKAWPWAFGNALFLRFVLDGSAQ